MPKDFFLLYKIQHMKTFVISVFTTLSSLSFAQSKVGFFQRMNSSRMVEKGIEQYNLGGTSDAYMTFKQASVFNPGSARAFYYLASVEFELKSFYEAETHVEAAIRLNDKKLNGDLHLLAGQIHHNLNHLDSAISHYQTCTKLIGDKLAKEYAIPLLLEQSQFAKKEQEKGILSLRTPLSEINTKYDEYAPILTQSGQALYFTAKNPDAKGDNMNPEDQSYFEDIYFSYWNDTTKTYKITYSEDTDWNTEGFDALNCVLSDGLHAYGTLNTSASKEKTTESSEIFELTAEKPFTWDEQKMVKIPGVNTSFFDGSACMTDTFMIDEYTYKRELYFVSDRRAEKSLTDLFVATETNGVWGESVIALPDFINSSGRETTPFITEDGSLLFFSSEALPGMGGYDVYFCKRTGNQWSAPVNLGAAFNTVNDDTHFQYYPALGKAVMAGISELDGLFNYNIFQMDLNGKSFPFMK
jgi:tetratricopeptide (TPR) repeat protein